MKMFQYTFIFKFFFFVIFWYKFLVLTYPITRIYDKNLKAVAQLVWVMDYTCVFSTGFFIFLYFFTYF